MAKSRRTRSVLNERDRERLEKIKTDPHSILKHVLRATIILHLGDGLTLSQTMRATGMSKPTVWRWWDRFLEEGVDGLLYDKPRRRGRKPVSEDKVRALIALAMSPPPAQGPRQSRGGMEEGTPEAAGIGIVKKNHNTRTSA